MNSQGKKSLVGRLAPSAALVFTSLLGAALAGSAPAQAAALGLIPDAQAEEGGHSSHTDGHSGGGRGGGGHSSDHAGHDDAGSHAGGRGGGKGQGRGQGGSHDAARGGKAVEDQVLRGGGKPWAREGIPEVELGRLNVARAPGHVLARAEQEALSTHTPNMAALYNLSAEQAAALLQTQFADVERYDSPLQNLALYKDIMTFGATQLPGVTPASQLDLAAIFLGAASDKTIPISEDTVTAVNRILGLVELEPADRATLASKAETVRAAILTGHGPDTEH
jgi:hypothetical protein